MISKTSEYMTKKTETLKAVQLEMLNKLLSVCNKYNLKIFADGGTLLGTIRHKGYIPWDDDIDMAMLREDYDKLRMIASKEFSSPYFFQCLDTEKGPYANGHAQIRKDDTTAIISRDTYISKKIHKGIFIDIFVFDEMPNNEIKRLSMITHIRTEMNLLKKRMCYSRLAYPFRYSKIRDYIRYYISQDKFYQRGLKLREYVLSFSSKENEFVCPIFFRQEEDFIKRHTFRKDWYKAILMLPFEDIMIPVPVEYDKILTQKYGDYMTPVHENTMHGGYVIIDTEKSYKEYGF